MWRDFQKTLEDRVFSVIAGSIVLVVTLMACWLVAAERREPSDDAAMLVGFPDAVDEICSGLTFGSKHRVDVDAADDLLPEAEEATQFRDLLPLEYCACCERNRPIADWVIYGVAEDLAFTEDAYAPAAGDRIEWKVTATSENGAPLVGIWYCGTVEDAGMDVSLSVNGVGCGRLKNQLIEEGAVILAEMPAPRMIHAGDVIVLTVNDPKSVKDVRVLQPAGDHARRASVADNIGLGLK